MVAHVMVLVVYVLFIIWFMRLGLMKLFVN